MHVNANMSLLGSDISLLAFLPCLEIVNLQHAALGLAKHEAVAPRPLGDTRQANKRTNF
jgi:hypothetical protein